MLSARASSSAKVRDSPVWGICKAVRWGNFLAERLKTSVSHRIPFWCGTFTRGRSPKTSVNVYWQVSACPSGTFSTAQRYRRQAANVSAKKAPTAVVTKIVAKTLPHILVSLDSQVLRDSHVLSDA